MTLQRHPALHAPTTPSALPAPPIPAAPGPATSRDPEAFVAAVVQWYLEFRAGRRQVDQLRQLMTPTLLRRLSRRAADRLPAPPLRPVRRVLVQQRDRATWSGVALVRHADGRTTALTLAMCHDGTRWWLTELTAPEDGDRPAGDVPKRRPCDDVDDLWVA